MFTSTSRTSRSRAYEHRSPRPQVLRAEAEVGDVEAREHALPVPWRGRGAEALPTEVFNDTGA
eukprot:11162954-Lingulodinium_polyedra.AAC.1